MSEEFKKNIEDIVEKLALTEVQKKILMSVLSIQGDGIEDVFKIFQLAEEKLALTEEQKKIINNNPLTDIEREAQKSDRLMSKITEITEKQNDLLKAGVRAINVLNECEDWHTGQLDKMSEEQLILIIHNQFVENLKEIGKLRKNKMVRVNILFYNAVFNEILNRLNLPTLKEIYKKYK